MFEGHFTLLRQISRKLYKIRSQKLKLLIRNETSAFRWYECRWPWPYFKVIRLFHIKFLVHCALYGKSYYKYKVLIENHFDWCHSWWLWSTFEGHFSLGCHFHVHSSNPWHAFASHGPWAIANLLACFTYSRAKYVHKQGIKHSSKHDNGADTSFHRTGFSCKFRLDRKHIPADV